MPPSLPNRVALMALGAALLIVVIAGAGMAALYLGVYNVSANGEHTRPVHWLLEKGMRASVRRRAAEIVPPHDLSDPELLRLGAHCFHAMCARCHGAPGFAPDDIAKSLLPIPNTLVQTARDWPLEQVYWVTRNGIRMTGMPAWEYRLADREIWAIAAFVDRELPRLTVPEYADLVGSVADRSCSTPTGSAVPTPERGRAAIRQYSCQGCHIIPGIVGPDAHVGPPLDRFARRAMIAGVVPNTRENLILWLRTPGRVSPRTMMPDLGVTEAHAIEMAAYLETLK